MLFDQLVHVAAGKVRPPYRVGKQGVARKNEGLRLGVQTNPAAGVAGRVEDLELDAGLVDGVPILEKNVRGLRRDNGPGQNGEVRLRSPSTTRLSAL